MGATPVDFAYAVHTNLGHRCRGARVDGAMVPLHHALKNGERVEIIAAKQGGPSRDWLNPELGYAHSHRARTKVRQWFKAQQHEETLAQGRAIVERELARAGATAVSLDAVAVEGGLRASRRALRGRWRAPSSTRGRSSDGDPAPSLQPDAAPEPETPSRRSSRGRARRRARAAASSSSASIG